MAKRNNKQQLNKIYANALPVTLSSEKYGIALPNLFPHNPISWLFYLVRLVQVNTLYSVPQSTVELVNVKYEDSIFKVTDEESIAKLWRSGFFGKGTLSRSEPTWKERTINRLNLEENEANVVSMEEVTSKRRDERKKFKTERSKLQDLELKERKGDISADEAIQLENLRNVVPNLRSANFKPGFGNDNKDTVIRLEDLELIESNILIKNLEFLQLQAIEVFFLKFALNVVQVSNLTMKQLFYECCLLVENSPSPNVTNKFILDYVVYHHYRSLGWCVRSGVKFGCDQLLYKRGPPFTHAEYCILIIPNDGKEKYDWFEMAAKARVIGTVKKSFVLVYVDFPTQAKFDLLWNSEEYEDEGQRFHDILHSYKVTEVLYRRWAPSKTRD
ncbi:uncharacterized protein RJT20DRAFT_129509 [Scheffersomyces xylosifermentans]|uniref:uncharacterized protein n=1 Tax=Scheffersomyces xylosifermentans TaxID=1304137 RepID=UPI00315DA553